MLTSEKLKEQAKSREQSESDWNEWIKNQVAASENWKIRRSQIIAFTKHAKSLIVASLPIAFWVTFTYFLALRQPRFDQYPW